MKAQGSESVLKLLLHSIVMLCLSSLFCLRAACALGGHDQSALDQRVIEIHEQSGSAFLHKIREEFPTGAPRLNSAQLLTKLELISPGWKAWSLRLETPSRDKGQPSMPTHAGTRSPDRAVYVTAAIAICSMVLIGFWQTYFSKLFSARSEPLTVLVHVHGALMAAWIALFVVQVALATAGRVDLHRRLGLVGFALLALILIVAAPTTIVAAKLGGHHMPGPALPGLALVSAAFAEFVTLGGLGLFFRHRSGVHKRLMVLATFAAADAGVARLPLDLLDSIGKVHLATDLVLLTVIAIDTVRHRRLHPAFLWGSVFLVAFQALSAWISGTAWWLHVARGIMDAFR